MIFKFLILITILLKFQGSEYDLYEELQELTAKTGNTISKEIRIAIQLHIDNSKEIKYKQGWLGFWKRLTKKEKK